jgi:spoIIIJ-associated protein
MDSIEADGDSIDAAIQNALATLGVGRERVEIEILTAGSRGLFGIGSRQARVRATLRRPVVDTEDDAGADVRPPAAAAPSEAAVEDAAERAAQLLREIVQHIGVSAEVVVRRDAEGTVLELTGDTSGVLIGRRGQMLDALEYLVNRILSRDDDGTTHFVVDSQNYRLRRREALEELARRMAAQAKKKGRPVAMNPMSPRDRRIVHLALRADPTLTTRSSGTGHFRKLVIIPDATKGIARAEG